MNNQLHNQIKQLSDRELLEGIYQMLLVVMQEQLISDSKQLGINVIADLLVDNMYRNKVRVTGITSNETLRYVIDGDTSLGELATIIFDMKKDGEYELPASTYSATYNMKWQVIAASYPHTCNITIEQIPSYPNALVTDGVDDYGQVQNLQQGVKMLFMTANPLGLCRTWYAQDSFSIYGQPGITAYNFRNTGGVTYLDGILNEAEVSNNLLNKKQTVTIVNPTDGGNNSIIFFNSYGSSYMNMAFYGSIGFDSVPTKQNDGFTEQDLIDYVLENLITK